MNYLGWELARQRAALWALLSGEEPGEEEDSPSREDASARGREAAGVGTRRSPAGLARARGRGAGRAGRYAAGREQAGDPLVGGPGAWEVAREAAGGRLDKAPEDLETPVSAWERVSGQEAGASAQGSGGAEAGGSELSRQWAAEEVRRTPRFGTGGAKEPPEFSGGPGTLEAARKTGAEFAAEARPAAAAGGSRAGTDSAAGGIALDMGLPSELWSGGGKAAGNTSAVMSSGGIGPARLGGGGSVITPGQRGHRVLPWGGESAALRAEAEARALSQAVQRDARRYDGGFTIY